MLSGIYKIVNKINNKFYLGSSKNLEKRWIQHKSNLEKDNHINIILQRAWNKYGQNNFEFIILESCEESKLFEREQFYIDTLKPKYNVGLKSIGGDNLTNNPKRDDIIKRMSIANKEKYERLTDEEKTNYSEKYKGDKNPNFGNSWTEEMKKEASNRSTEYFKTHKHYKIGKKHEEIYGEEKAKEMSENLSKFASNRTGNKNAFFDKHHTEEYKKKASDRMKGKYYGEQNIPLEVEGKRYESLGVASKELKIPITTIRWRIKSSNVKFTGYKYL